MIKEKTYYNKNTEKVFKNNAGQKPLRYNEDALSKNLLNKKIKITLLNNQVFEGILINLGVYDLTIRHKVNEQFGQAFRESDKDVIILKSAICTVEVL